MILYEMTNCRWRPAVFAIVVFQNCKSCKATFEERLEVQNNIFKTLYSVFDEAMLFADIDDLRANSECGDEDGGDEDGGDEDGDEGDEDGGERRGIYDKT